MGSYPFNYSNFGWSRYLNLDWYFHYNRDFHPFLDILWYLYFHNLIQRWNQVRSVLNPFIETRFERDVRTLLHKGSPRVCQQGLSWVLGWLPYWNMEKRTFLSFYITWVIRIMYALRWLSRSSPSDELNGQLTELREFFILNMLE